MSPIRPWVGQNHGDVGVRVSGVRCATCPECQRRSPIVLACSGSVSVGVSAGVGSVLAPAQIRDYGADKGDHRPHLLLAFFAGFRLAGAAAGWLVHRLGTRIALVIGARVVTPAGAYTATRPPVPAFVAVQLAAGVGIGMLESVLTAHLSELPSA